MDVNIFISYATKDTNIFHIADLSHAIEKMPGIKRVFFWEEAMKDDIIKYMNDNIGLCEVILLFCTQNSLASDPVQMEWMSALKLGKTIIPVFFDPKDIPPLLSSKLGIQFNPNLIEFPKNIENIYKLIQKKVTPDAPKVTEEKKTMKPLSLREQSLMIEKQINEMIQSANSKMNVQEIFDAGEQWASMIDFCLKNGVNDKRVQDANVQLRKVLEIMRKESDRLKKTKSPEAALYFNNYVRFSQNLARLGRM